VYKLLAGDVEYVGKNIFIPPSLPSLLFIYIFLNSKKCSRDSQ
jgi:hypothetical protein